ncbi:MAG: hypothetical protein ABH828_03500 [archaeon]
MNRTEKTILELVALSFLFISLSVGVLLVFDRAFPEGFDSITGKATTGARVYIYPALPVDCNISFNPEWNLLSFFCITTYEDMNTFLQNISDYELIYTYRSADSVDPWKVYNPNMPVWVVQDLEYFSRKEGYWIYFNITNSTNYFFNGSKRIPTTVSLPAGWSLAGYPTNQPKLIEESLESINDTLLTVYTMNNTDKNMLNYTKSSGGVINETKPYQGYWIRTNASDNWVVTW